MATAQPPPVRVREPRREGIELALLSLEDAVPADHPVRLLWALFGRLDLSPFLVGIRSVRGRAGRSLYSPRMLLSLWAYGLWRGVGSARSLARATREDLPCRWLVGDVRPTHHVLSAFVRRHRDAFDALLTEVLAALLGAGLVRAEEVSVDGTRVRASASTRSFAGRAVLEERREQAALHLKAVLDEQGATGASATEHAARLAGARALAARVEAALAELGEREKKKPPPATGAARPRAPRAPTPPRAC